MTDGKADNPCASQIEFRRGAAPARRADRAATSTTRMNLRASERARSSFPNDLGTSLARQGDARRCAIMYICADVTPYGWRPVAFTIAANFSRVQPVINAEYSLARHAIGLIARVVARAIPDDPYNELAARSRP